MIKPIQGQTLYALNVNNMARNRPQELRPVVVAKVGRKFFTVQCNTNGYWMRDFHLDTWREKSEYSPDWQLYASEQGWADEKESNAIVAQIRQVFAVGKCTVPVSKLREIKTILERQ